MNLVLVKYNAGNIRSVIYALERLGITPVLSDDPETIQKADKVIFPGVGEASSTMRSLRATQLDKVIPALTQPVLGICLGMQLMCRHSEEGDADCLGIFEVEVRRFPERKEKVPHMGWNVLSFESHPLLKNLPGDPYVYFVHSYYVENSPWTIATSDYILPFSAAMQRDNFYATQFHPEKSSKVGSKLLENFLTL